MAVYFEPRPSGWADYIAPAAQELLRGLVGGMFDRDKQARDLKHQNSLADAEQTRKQEAIDRAAAFLNNPGTVLDLRGDRDAAQRNWTLAGMYAPHAMDVMKQAYPGMQLNTTNLGDRTQIGSFDPGTGAYSGQDYAHGIDPTQKYAQDEATQRQQMADKAANYRAGVAAQARPAPPQLVQDGTGQYIYLDPVTAQARSTGVMGASKSDPKALLGAYTKLIELYTDPVSNLPLPGYADFVVGLTNDVRDLMNTISGANKLPVGQTQRGQLPGKTLTPDQHQWLRKQGLTDEMIRKDGYIIP